MSEKTPLYDLTANTGAVFVEENGWPMPAHYGDTAAEYQSACRDAALFDISHHGKVELRGKDVGTFLHNVSTNEVNKLPSGSGCESFLTTGQAKIVAYVRLFRARPDDQGDAFWLDPGPGMAEKVIKHLDRHLISEQVEIIDRTCELAQLHVAGPRASEALGRVLQGALPGLAELGHCAVIIAGNSVTIRRHHPVGLPGYDVLCPAERAEGIWRVLREAGARPAGLEAYRTLRVEAGTPVYGIDIDENNLPQEVGRTDQTISFTKGCYIGQETVARIRTYGHVNRSLVGLRLPGPGAVEQGAKLFRSDKEIGHITSSVVSPRLQTAIALAYVRRGNQEPGTTLELEDAGGRRLVEVVSLPFVGPGSGHL